jgi:type I restriction enzyme, R subunit
MATAIHTESRFEDEICEHLKNHGWLFYGPLPEVKGFAYDEGYDRALALFPGDAINWVKETQPETWEKFVKNHPKNPEEIFLKRLSEELNLDRPTIKKDKPQLWGSLYVLRRGFKDINATFKMAQFKPANKQNQKLLDEFSKNKLRVVRQVHYSLNNEKCIDLVLFLNGIPLATIELKTDTTQSIWDAVKQYRDDRPPIDPERKQAEPLLSFGKRALVHFAVSCDEVQMTTKLEGKGTRFLPFNLGIPDGEGGASAGNPVDKKLGYSTGYLWTKVFERENFLDIFGKFISVEVSEKNDLKRKTIFQPSLLFPRYHQWSAVNALLDGVLNEGVGESYLIQHSAGSGKSNTIGWLAHRLASLHDAADSKVFDSVIVITDRRVLDSQLQDTIYQFDHQQGVVEKIDQNATQLAEALNDGKKIIITTLQKVGSLGSKKFALIIDEAHSSQSGKSAVKLREALTKDELDELDVDEEGADDAEDSINEEVERQLKSREKPKNVSYFAFTATPKAKTIELFGRLNAQGLPEPYHVYSMRQAIEEGFILDVLKGYSTYDGAFKLEQSGKDKDVKSGSAKKKLFIAAEMHPTSISQKVTVIVEHFREHVMHLLSGRAKAMVVTSSRKAAGRYKVEFDKYIKKHGYHDCKALIAFSGSITDKKDGYHIDNLTEAGFNDKGQKDDTIKEDFNTDEYKVLLVANKYQTGFDQPLLCAMYVDKRLDGVLAVQTLSRLNRVTAGKTTTFVLDFRNDPQEILKSFQQFYKTAKLSGITDRNLVHTLKNKLDSAEIYHWDEVEEFANSYFNPKGKQSGIQAPLKQAFERFKLEKKESQELFRGDLSSYISAYDFLSQLINYEDVDLEKLHAFAKSLLPRLRTGIDDNENLDGAARLIGYKLINHQTHNLNLDGNSPEPLKPMGPGGGEPWDDPYDKLSGVIQKMNEIFSGNLSDADFRGAVVQLVSELEDDPKMVEEGLANETVESFGHGAYKQKLTAAFIKGTENRSEISDQALKDAKVFNQFAELLLPVLYERIRDKHQNQSN